MKDIAFHITDISENCIRAGASRMRIELSFERDLLTLVIADNGCGMSPETIRKATDPFYTTRTTRKVGLGLPFLIQNAQQSGGDVLIDSKVGEGTTVTATFRTDSIDCPPTGDIAETLMQIIAGNPAINTEAVFRNGADEFRVTTDDLKEIMDGIPLGHPRVAKMIKELLADNFKGIFGRSLIL